MADQNLNWYTRTYPNFLDDELCDAYVQMFEETLEKEGEKLNSMISCLSLKNKLKISLYSACKKSYWSSLFSFSSYF